jgi:general secretion pathway protein F
VENVTVTIVSVSLLLLAVVLLFAPRLVLKILAATILALVLFGVLITVAGPIGALFWLATGVVAAMTLVQLRINQQRAFLDLLALAAQKRMPLPPLVTAFAADQPAGYRRKLRRVADALQAGTPLGEAISRVRSALPRQAVVAVQMGERTGTLPTALRDSAHSNAAGSRVREALIGRLFYLAWMGLMAPSIAIFVAIKIFPAFVAIFNDFEIALPSTTVLLFRVVRSEPAMLAAFYGELFGMLALLYFVLYYIGVVPAPTFGLGAWAQQGHVLRALALAVEGQRPFGEALEGLAESYPSFSVARRLRATAVDVQSGSDWAGSLLKYSLVGRSDAAAMQAAQRVGNLPWAMRQLADARERRLAYRLEAALNIVSPLVVLALGAVVFFFVVGCFLPLVYLIQSLA